MDITSANSVFTLNVPDVFATPQLLQGYATDDAFATPEVDTAEALMGVDGRMSAGYTPYITKLNVTFQADSPSITNTLEAWLAAQQASQQVYFANAAIALPSLGKQYVLTNGVLTRATPLPPAKKILQPVTYELSFESCDAMPYG